MGVFTLGGLTTAPASTRTDRLAPATLAALEELGWLEQVGVVEIDPDISDTAATRVWSAVECLQKAGIMAGAPLTVLPGRKEAWVEFAVGGIRIATFVTALRDALEPAVFAFLVHDTDRTEGRP